MRCRLPWRKTRAALLRRSCAVLFPAAALLLLWLSPLHAEEDLERGLARVHGIRLEGVQSLSEGKIKKVLKTKTKRWFALWKKAPLLRQDFVRSDIRAIELFYARNGFLDASASSLIDRQEDSDRAVVTFVVEEGERSYTREIFFSPVFAYEEDELKKRLKLRVDQPFNPVQVGLDRDRLLEVYADRGHFPTIVAGWARDSTSVFVDFEIEEGPGYRVGEIGVGGLERVDTVVVRRELLLRRGEMFRSSHLRRSVERLYGTGLFQVVDFTPTRVDTDSAVVDMSIWLRERKHKRLEGGAGFGTADGIRLLAGWSNINLWGRGSQLGAQTSVWLPVWREGLTRFQNSLAYTEPWLFGSPLQGRAALFLNQVDANFEGQVFTERSWGLGLGVSREFSRYFKMLIGWENQWSQAVSLPDLPAEDLERFDRTLFTSKISFNPVYDDRNDKFDARRGQFYRLIAEFAAKALGSEGVWQKLTLSGAWHFNTSPGASISIRQQIGRIWSFANVAEAIGQVPVSDLYRTGGANSVRGYHEQGITGESGLGGLLFLVSNMEYRFPMTRLFSGSVFVDGGNVWSRPSEFNIGQILPPKPGELLAVTDYKWSLGGGLRLGSPVGPIRFDLAWRPYREAIDVATGRGSERWMFHLSFGQPF
jgi:outer membrane protein insertion porin family